jgi:hypothetical protein
MPEACHLMAQPPQPVQEAAMPYYLGKGLLGDWILFASTVAPTKETHGHLYTCDEGPWLEGFVTWTMRRVLFIKNQNVNPESCWDFHLPGCQLDSAPKSPLWGGMLQNPSASIKSVKRQQVMKMALFEGNRFCFDHLRY